ncbi:MAG: M2 family metallopeptidase, partial [Candidatus Nanoarchaeia archaeon]
MQNKEAESFIKTHYAKLIPLNTALELSYFNAITTGKKEYYNEYENLSIELNKLYNSKEDFAFVKKLKSKKLNGRLLKRQIDLIYNSFLSAQGDINLIKKIIGLSAKIEKSFNTFRASIDGKEFTQNEINDILKKSTDSEELEKAWMASKEQGAIVEKDIINLVKLRNELAQSLGFSNYYEFSMHLSEQDMQEIKKIFDDLSDLTENPFKELKKQVDDCLKKMFNVIELFPWHYKDPFFQEGPEIYKLNLDKYYSSIDVIDAAENFYKSIGLEVSDILKRSDLYEKPGKFQHACCTHIDRNGDIRIVENAKNNEKWMTTTLHELGHAVYEKFIDKNLPFMLKQASHIFTTEAIAQFFGKMDSSFDFLQNYGGINTEELVSITKDLKSMVRLNSLVFARWSLVMFNFEKSLYENPNQDLNKLWYDLVKKYQLINFYRDKPDWASKTHLATAPAYYHNYLLGELLASQLRHYLKNNPKLSLEQYFKE